MYIFHVFGLPTEKLCDINAKFMQEPAEVRSRTWLLWKVRVNAYILMKNLTNFLGCGDWRVGLYATT
jgi:hypothetical protein